MCVCVDSSYTFEQIFSHTVNKSSRDADQRDESLCRLETKNLIFFFRIFYFLWLFFSTVHPKIKVSHYLLPRVDRRSGLVSF